MTYKFAEVEFKGSRKEIYSNSEEYPLKLGENVIVRVDKGVDIGKINRLMHEPRRCESNGDIFIILRRASENELDQFRNNRNNENEARVKARELAK